MEQHANKHATAWKDP